MEYGLASTMREVLAVDRTDPITLGGGALLLHDDVPLFWDAWDISRYYMETASKCVKRVLQEQDLTMLSQHHLKIAFVFDCEGGSVIKQNVIINDYSKRIQYDVNVDWKEAHKLLKVYFPLNVRSDFATYDIQFGNLQRPTAPNTSWLVF